MVLLVDGDGVRAFGDPLEAESSIILDWTDGSELFALTYERPLEALDPPLMPGEIASASGPGRPIGEPSQAFVAVTDEATWRPVDRSMAPPFEVPLQCAAFDVEVQVVDGGRSGFAVSLEEDRVLLGEEKAGGRVFLVTSESVSTVTTAAAMQQTAAMKGDGGLWFGGPTGVWRGSLQGLTIEATRVIEPTTTGGAIRFMGGSTAPEAFELFVTTREGAFERYHGGSWELLWQFPVDNADSNTKVLYVGPEEAIAISDHAQDVVRYAAGEVYVEPLNAAGTPNAVGLLPTFGHLVGTNVGEIARYERGGWVPIGTSDFGIRVRTFYPFQDGFLFAGAGGWVGQYSGDRFCPSQVIGTDTVRELLPLGGHPLGVPTDLAMGLMHFIPRAQ